jgi:hypothetical protein
MASFARRLTQLAKLDILVIDDFAISPMGAAERNDLLEVLDDRIGSRSTLITSQLPVKAWHLPGRSDARGRDPGPRRAQQPQDRAQRQIAARNSRRQMTPAHHRFSAQHDLPTASCVRRKRRPPPWISLRRAVPTGASRRPVSN